MEEKGTKKNNGRKGFRSLTLMLVLTICFMVFVPVVALVCLGMYQISQSSEESVGLYETSDRKSTRLNSSH